MKRLTKPWMWALSLAAASLSMSGAAQARGVYWSVDVDAPVVVGGTMHTEFSNAPPVRYVQAPPVIVAPAPVYVERPWCPPRVAYVPARPVVVDAYPSGGWRFRHDGRDGDWHRHGWGHEHWEHERREHRDWHDED